MNYELAKELEDAGFPQGYTGGGSGLYICQHERHETAVRYDCDDVYVPTLSELIEACEPYRRFFVGETGGYEHFGLNLLYTNELNKNYNDPLQWKATYKPYLKLDDSSLIPPVCFGSTLEEAVARLGLALNKK